MVQSSLSFCSHSLLSPLSRARAAIPSRIPLQTSVTAFRLSITPPSVHLAGRQLLLHASQACSLLSGTPCIWLVAAVSNFPWDALCLRAASPLLRCHGNHCYSASEPHLPSNNVCMCLCRYWFLGYLKMHFNHMRSFYVGYYLNICLGRLWTCLIYLLLIYPMWRRVRIPASRRRRRKGNPMPRGITGQPCHRRA
jgi:hypothetical protein